MATKSNEENDGGGAGRGAERFRPTSLFELVREPLGKDEARPRREPPTEGPTIDLNRDGYNKMSKWFEEGTWQILYEMLKNAVLDVIDETGDSIPRHAFQDKTLRADILILLSKYDNFFKKDKYKMSAAWKAFFKAYGPFFLARVLNVCDEQLARTIPHLFQFLAGFCGLAISPAAIGIQDLQVFKIEEKFIQTDCEIACIFLGVGAHILSSAEKGIHYNLQDTVMTTLCDALDNISRDPAYSTMISKAAGKIPQAAMSTASSRRPSEATAEEQIEFLLTTSKSAIRSVAEMGCKKKGDAPKRRFVKIYQVDDKYDSIARCKLLHKRGPLKKGKFKKKWKHACWPKRSMDYIASFVSRSRIDAGRKFRDLWKNLLPSRDRFSSAVSSICRGELPKCCADKETDATLGRPDLWYATGEDLKKESCVQAFGISRCEPARAMSVDFVKSSLLKDNNFPPNNPFFLKVRHDQHRSHCEGRDSPTHGNISRPSAGDTSPNPGTLAVKRERSGRTPPSDNPKRSRTTRNVAAASCVRIESESTPHAS